MIAILVNKYENPADTANTACANDQTKGAKIIEMGQYAIRQYRNGRIDIASTAVSFFSKLESDDTLTMLEYAPISNPRIIGIYATRIALGLE